MPRHVARVAELTTPEPVVGRFGREKEAPPHDQDLVETMLRTDVIRPARAHLAKRAVAVASIAEFVVETQSSNGSGED